MDRSGNNQTNTFYNGGESKKVIILDHETVLTTDLTKYSGYIIGLDSSNGPVDVFIPFDIRGLEYYFYVVDATNDPSITGIFVGSVSAALQPIAIPLGTVTLTFNNGASIPGDYVHIVTSDVIYSVSGGVTDDAALTPS